METNSELEFASLKSPVIALRAMPPSFSKRVFRTKPPLKKEVARSAGGFLGDKLQFKVFISQKSPVIALRAMPPSFSKRVLNFAFKIMNQQFLFHLLLSGIIKILHTYFTIFYFISTNNYNETRIVL